MMFGATIGCFVLWSLYTASGLGLVVEEIYAIFIGSGDRPIVIDYASLDALDISLTTFAAMSNWSSAFLASHGQHAIQLVSLIYKHIIAHHE